MVETPLRERAEAKEKLLSSIFQPVMSTELVPKLESSNQSDVPPVPEELITSVIRIIPAPNVAEVSPKAKSPDKKKDLSFTHLTKHKEEFWNVTIRWQVFYFPD